MVKRTPSMLDVASLAGVSHQTVSRVVNGHSNVKESTRLKVESAMQDLGFRPSRAARSLVTGRSAMIGVLSHDTTLWGPASVLHAVQSAARELGFTVALISLKSIYPAAVLAGLEEFANIGVEGVVIIAPQTVEYEVLRKIPGNLPAVIIEGEESRGMPSVEVDQIQGAVIATEHLIELGHRNIAHISGPSNWFASQARKNGWQQAMNQAKLKAVHCMEGDWSPNSGYLATKEILKTRAITAIFSGNDEMALGAYRAINEAGLSIPGDISLVGFDDIPTSAYFAPSLTTVRQDFDQCGHLALTVLLKMVRRERIQAKKILVAPELIVRKSTAKPLRK